MEGSFFLPPFAPFPSDASVASLSLDLGFHRINLDLRRIDLELCQIDLDLHRIDLDLRRIDLDLGEYHFLAMIAVGPFLGGLCGLRYKIQGVAAVAALLDVLECLVDEVALIAGPAEVVIAPENKPFSPRGKLYFFFRAR